MADRKIEFDSMKIREVIVFLEECERKGVEQVIIDAADVGVGSINYMTTSQDEKYAILGFAD